MSDPEISDVYESPLHIHLSQVLFDLYGPMMAGEKLSMAIGFSTHRAMRQAKHRSTLGIAVMDFPHRPIKFALAEEVAWWLANQRLKNNAEPVLLGNNSATNSDRESLILMREGVLLHEERLLNIFKVKSRSELNEKRLSNEIKLPLFMLDNHKHKQYALTIEAIATGSIS